VIRDERPAGLRAVINIPKIIEVVEFLDKLGDC